MGSLSNLWVRVRKALSRLGNGKITAITTASHLVTGKLGESLARQHLTSKGLTFLTANFKTRRGEIDLIFRDGENLLFVEVKTRSSEEWSRPAAAVDKQRQGRMARAALDYLRLLKNPKVRFRFDIVEVVLANPKQAEIRHLENVFSLPSPLRYG